MPVLASVPITYKVSGGGTTHAPMIIASVGGVEARLVLDTGSEVHLLNEEFADELRLAKEPGEEGEQMHDPQGIVEMDVLRGTVLCCAADLERPVYWCVQAAQDL